MIQKVPLLQWHRYPWLVRRRLVYPGLLTFFFLVLSISALAQYRFDNWTTDNGLPQNSVNAITQTRDGYLWFTTSDGLVRFDGVRFTIFDQSNTKEFKSNRFIGLYEDPQGTLWAGTEVGLVRYRDGIFTTLITDAGLPDNWIFQIQGRFIKPGGLFRWRSRALPG